jgi:DNA-binding Lrp family transcriptional regulator
MSSTTGAGLRGLSEKQRRILSFLRDNAETQTYFKSRLIGDALGLSAKEVGTNMTAIAASDVALTVEKWGYSSATTWKVTV